MLLHKLNDLVYVKIISRPSKICKTPYVADIELPNGEIVQGQTSGDTATIGTQITELQSPHHYEKDGFHVPRGTAGSSEVTILQHERDKNDRNKKIKVIRPELINDVAKQFRSIVRG